MSARLRSIQRRLDAVALEQLRAEAARLIEENENLRERLSRAEDDARWWAEESTRMHLDLCEARVGAPGITREGHLVLVQGGAH